MTGLQHKDDYLETPEWLVENIELSTGLKFTLDLCATHENRKTLHYIDEHEDLLKQELDNGLVGFCNPPRSKNGKFVSYILNQWLHHNVDIVMLLCWNDLGNKYSTHLRELILENNSNIEVGNLGKMIFNKDGKPTLFPSRLSYFWVWLKKS